MSVFMDESMPGIIGAGRCYNKFKKLNTTLPIVMITKNEAENIMEEAIGSQIDRLPHQTGQSQPGPVSRLKKSLITNDWCAKKLLPHYQQEFRNIP